MDLLLTPADPAFPTDDTPYLAGDKRWERGRFPTYVGNSSVSTLANLKALPREELPGFLQTWLFFGLVAEFLGLNEQEDGKHIVDPSQAQAELDVLYEESVIVKEDGGKYITGLKVLSLMPLIRKRIMAAARIASGIGLRLMCLDHCLHYAYEVTFEWTEKVLDDNIIYSLAALGELFSRAVRAVNYELELNLELEASSYSWEHEYLVKGGWLEGKMLAHGWCSSGIEKLRRQVVGGLNAKHYVSRLRKSGPRRDHSRCHKDRCLAFQIRMDGYQLAHTEQCRGCDLLDVDLDGMMSILEKTHSFPVLTGKTAWNEVYQRDEAQVEAFEPEMPYVAISHVWADGLGNPTANALPRCQVNRLSSLVAKLQKAVDSGWKKRGRNVYRSWTDRRKRRRNPYRIWVDSLCCPVESNGKSIALERMADVYRNATHVLVLDGSFTEFTSEDIEPAELLFRAVSCSAWMRRLWTFQEGAFARSLYYQFADCAVTSKLLLPKVSEAGDKDIRYRELESALWYEINANLTSYQELGMLEHMSDPRPIRDPHEIMWNLQSALNFRSVSVPRDEPLCIATILGLDISRVANETGENATQKRMAVVWKMIAARLGGIPPFTIFYVDNPLDIVGFRWAPKSLLAADIQQSTGDDTSDPYTERPFFDSALIGTERESRFICHPGTKLAELVSEGDRKGLQCSYPGFRVYARPYSGVEAAPEQYRLHPWDSVLTQNTKDRLLLKEQYTGRWFTVWVSDITSKTWADKDVGTPICKAIHTGQCAIIRQTAETVLMFNGTPQSKECLVVLVKQQDETEFIVRKQLNVRLREATEAGTTVAETMTELAEELASEQVTADFISVRDQIESEEYALVRKKLVGRMQELVAEAWKARPDFANAAKVSLGEGSQEYMWEHLARRYSHRFVLERTPDDQLWLVD